MNRSRSNLRLPLLGEMTPQQLRDTLTKTIIDEATAAEFYARLLKEAPNPLHYEFIDHARGDELEHLNRFEELYFYYFGTKPRYKIEPISFADYKDGLLMALKDELAAAEFYRDVQLSVRDQLARDTYYYAMVDEIGHATRFSTLYNQV